MIRPLIQRLTEYDWGAVDTVFVVGAGSASDLPVLRRLRATKLVLAEAHPEIAEMAGRRVDAAGGEEVWPVAITPTDETGARLNVLDQWRYSSLLPPGRLLDYFPNMEMEPAVGVESRSIMESMVALDLDGNGVNGLILDAPGQAFGLLRSISIEVLQSLAWVIVCCASDPLYKGEEASNSVLGMLREVGFDVAMESTEAVFPERGVLMIRNDAAVDRHQLKAALNRVRDEQVAMISLLKSMQSGLNRNSEVVATQDGRVDTLCVQVKELAMKYDLQSRSMNQARDEQVAMISLLKSMQLELSGSSEAVAAQDGRVDTLCVQMKELAMKYDLQSRSMNQAHDEQVAMISLLKSMQLELSGSSEVVAAQDGRVDTLCVQMKELTIKYDLQSRSTHTTEMLSRLEGRLDALPSEFREDLVQTTQHIFRKMNEVTRNAAKQVQAFIGVHGYLATGELQSLSTERHGWPISPDFAQYLLELIEIHDYDVVIEFGSGVSTVTMAKAFARRAVDHKRGTPVDMVSFDHLESYFKQTQSYLSQAGLADSVDLELAPLQPYEAANGSVYLYYDCAEVLRALAEQHAGRAVRTLVVVDGPPGKTGKHARYPAMPVVLSFFAEGRVDFLMDDYVREDEKEIVEIWQEELSAAGIGFQIAVRSLEKDACFFMVRPEEP